MLLQQQATKKLPEPGVVAHAELGVVVQARDTGICRARREGTCL